MKISFVSFTFLLLLFIACDTTDQDISVPVVVPKEVIEDGFLTRQFKYNGKKLDQILRRQLFDIPQIGPPFIDTFFIDFKYDSTGHLVHIQHGHESITVSYEGNDLILKSIGSAEYTARFLDYKNVEIPKIEVNLKKKLNQIYVQYDTNHNVIHATDQNGVSAEDAFWPLNDLMFAYVSNMNYDDKYSPFKNLDLEVQLYLNWNKNPNNLLRRIFGYLDRWYTNEYNYAGFLTKQNRIDVDKEGNLINNPMVTEYNYIVIP